MAEILREHSDSLGFSAIKMASILSLSRKRIDCIIKQLKQQLQCRSQLEIVSRAIKEGWIYLLEENIGINNIIDKNKKHSRDRK
ncbi:hypothetical protein [Rickettsiella endosymbiont of Dermanyssus gallinae]|uniref:hypothetical protein n=1 Tax=Rickettsiella endosymbiont of Dermanyssus gallinae TaxID=2856608 RepID=UPI001C53317E|nr:hypothetical protein [Rickettsiella endosymbiont of Dermanyssus gallinae]